MKILFLWFYPSQYIEYFHQRCPDVGSLSFGEHRRRLLDDHFDWSGDLSRYMSVQGLEIEFVVANYPALQKKWARENGVSVRDGAGWQRAIAMEQVRRLQPDIVWLPSQFDYFGEFTRRARELSRRVVIWVGEPWPPPPDLGGISVLITENPNTFHSVRHCLEKVIVAKPGYSPAIAAAVSGAAKQYDVTFVGQIHDVHKRRADVLAYLLRQGVRVALFGFTGVGDRPSFARGLRQAAWHAGRQRDFREAMTSLRQTLAPTAYERDVHEIRRHLKAPVFGMEMYRLLASSRIVLNVHGDIAGNHAGNKRLFEATMAGSCLLTEDAENIRELFEPGREILTYKTREEALDLIRAGLADSRRLDAIAEAGQRRTLQSHTIEKFFEDIRPAFEGLS